MADEKKRLTPEELRAQQLERAQLEAEARKKALEEVEVINQAKQRADVDQIKRAWYDDVVAASQKDKRIRFLVLAKVSLNYDVGVRLVNEIGATIGADGYSCETVILGDATPNMMRSLDEIAGRVLTANKDGGQTVGWKPAQVPSFVGPSCSNGSIRWLIVRW